jgi:hypothetical protein
MPEKGHTHNTRDRKKQAERNERKREQTKNNSNSDYYNKNIPQNNKQFIVALNGSFKGGTIINALKEHGTSIQVFIPNKCRLDNRQRQKVVKTTKYLLVEEIELSIRSSANCTDSLIHVYSDEEINKLKKIENKNEFWYWSKWLEELDENDDSDYDYNDDNSKKDDDYNDNTIEIASDIDIDNI